jgi:hypothetical protein
MKSAKILVSAILIPALLVASGEGASDSVQKLLRKPRADGTQADGTVNRVTTQFLTLRDANTCRQVELAPITSITWFPRPDDSPSVGDKIILITMVVIASPILIPLSIVEFLGHRDEDNSPVRGNWESTPTSPDGKIKRIEGKYGNKFVQQSVALEKGRYEVIGQDLHLVYDGSGVAEAMPLQFDCESLVLGDQKLWGRFSMNHAQAPIVGRWQSNRDRRSSWEFTASGTFEKRITTSQINGQIEKIKGGVRVKWLGPDAKPAEDWGLRTKGHHLFTTVGGATTEYVRAEE